MAFNLGWKMKDQSSLRPHQSAFAIACFISVVLWFLPFLRWVTVPIQYFNTHIHEAWHALATVATGGAVHRIEVHANGNGETLTSGGLNFVIASAGYLGAAIVGALVIAFARTPKSARVGLISLSVVMAYSLLVWVRGDPFGWISAIGWIVALLAMAMYLKDENRLFAAQFLGVQQCLNSIQSLFFLVHISGFGVKESDAGNMALMTHIPAIVWAVFWCIASLLLMLLALRFSWRSNPRSDSPEREWVR